MFKELEDAIIDRLKESAGEEDTSVLALVDIDPMPADPSSMMMIGPVGGIFVHYDGTDSSDPQGIGAGTQEDSISFNIYISTRNLRSGSDITVDPGAYEIMAAVRQSLTGCMSEVTDKPLFMKKCGFHDQQDGIWQYYMQFQCKAYFTGDEPAESAAVSKKITFKRQDGTETTIPEEN